MSIGLFLVTGLTLGQINGLIIRDGGTRIGPLGWVATELNCGANLTCSQNGKVATIDAKIAGGVGPAPANATYLTQTPNGTLTNEQAMSLSATGITINTTGTGVQSIYAGTSCTNQFPRSLSASGAATCASVGLNTDTTGALEQARGGTGNGFGLSCPVGKALTSDGINQSCTPVYVTVEDEGAPTTQRGTLNFTGAGVSCIDSGGKTVCTIGGGGGGSANTVAVTLDFGSGGNTTATTTVSGQAWVTGASIIVCSSTLIAVGTRAEGAEDAILEGLVAAVHTRSAGVGFKLTASPRIGRAYGQFIFHCTGA